MDKLDLKKDYKFLYKASAKKPTLIELPTWHYIALKGQGAPNTPLFSQSIEALFSVAYTISMSYKSQTLKIEGFEPFVCPPLEGHWSTIGVQSYDGLDKSVFEWEIRILMPSFVLENHLAQAKEIALKKKNNPRISDIEFISREGGKYCVMTHIGSFDSEPVTFKKMANYTEEQGLSRLSKDHEEIYLSDFRKVAEDKLKTVLAFEVK